MAQIYGDHAVNSLSGQIGGQAANAAPTPRTLSSASSRIDALNERLAKAAESLSMVSSQIGGLTPVPGAGNAKNSVTAASGAVHRLNDSADAAHSQISDIENLIAGIGRALG